jgi:hypothetical protein
LTKDQLENIREALKKQDWSGLKTWREKYVYQRFTRVDKDITEIGALAREIIDQWDDDQQTTMGKEANKIFGMD